MLETGLGGRLDGTTAVPDPLICVVTSISRDHMQILGNTIEEIAREKAGILVPGKPVVYDANDPVAATVLEKTAERLGCPSCPVTEEETRILGETAEGIDFLLKEQEEKSRQFRIPFVARYQVMNAAVAVRTLQMISKTLPVPEKAITEGLKKTRWPGRMEAILPGVILDGAHNEGGIERFVETAAVFAADRPVSLLFSAVSDKAVRSMIRRILSGISFRRVTVTEVGGSRGIPAEELAAFFRELGCRNVCCEKDPVAAFWQAVSAKEEKEILFCVGSLYLAGVIKAAVGGQS